MKNILKTTALAGVIAGAFAVPGAMALNVEDVNVAMKRVAADTEANDFFSKIGTDLADVIAGMTEAGEGEDAVDVNVSIRKISLDGTPIGPNAPKFNEMDGVVSIMPTAGGDAIISYPVRLAAYADDRPMPEGFIAVAPSNDDYYQSLLHAFAEETVDGLDRVPASTLDTEGADR